MDSRDDATRHSNQPQPLKHRAIFDQILLGHIAGGIQHRSYDTEKVPKERIRVWRRERGRERQRDRKTERETEEESP